MNEKFKLTKKSVIPPNISALAMPVIYLSILVLVSYFSVQTGYANIKKQRSEIASAKKMESVLSDKYSTLSGAQTTISNFVDSAVNALPSENPSLVLISQLRNAINQKPVIVEDIKLSSAAEVEDKYSELRVTFNAVGNINDIFSFFQDLDKLSPLIKYERFDITFVGDNISSETGAESYFSPFPDTLPAITQPIAKITPDEENLLNELTQLTPPTFTKLDPNGPYDRSNPFSL